MAISGTEIEEIAPEIWCWERRPRSLRPGEFGGRTSYALSLHDDLLLIDPLVSGDSDPALELLDELAQRRVWILVTMPYHTRSSELLAQRYRAAQARIYGHPAIATRLDDSANFEPVIAPADLAGIARFHQLGDPPRSQQPIEIPAARALVFGDAVVETGRGALRTWANPLDSEKRRHWWTEHYLPTLEHLAALDIDHVLVTHGKPAIGNGTQALREALQNKPWQRPERRAATTA